MRCSNIGPRGARNWFRVLDSPRQLLSPSSPDVLAPPRASKSLRFARAPARRHPPEKLERRVTTMQQYPRSPKVLLGGMAHLARFIDKIRMRHAGLIQDYNYITVGFEKYLLDFLQIRGEDFEKRVLQGGTDDEILAWVKAHARPPTDDDIRQWNERILNGVPKDEAARQRFQG